MDNLIETVDRVLARNMCLWCDGPATRTLYGVGICNDCYDVAKMSWAEYRGEVN